jgi:GT2 family glycosyltransferase
MRDEPAVSIVLVNWNGWKDTIECLASLSRLQYHRIQIVIVDNGSADGSVEKIGEYCQGHLNVTSPFFPDQMAAVVSFSLLTAEEAGSTGAVNAEPGTVTVITNQGNLGFAEANNQGTRFALQAFNPDYVLFLNNDTVVDPGFLTAFTAVAEEDPSIGFLGPKTCYYDYQGRRDVINFAGGELSLLTGNTVHIGQNQSDQGQFDTQRTVDYVEGSCLLARSSMLRQIGLLDPGYFVYYEENDLVMRGRKEGFSAVYVPTAVIWHKVSASSKKTPIKTYYMARNRFWFMKRHAGWHYPLFLIVFFLSSFWLSTGIHLLYYKSPDAFRAYARGVRDGLRGPAPLPKTL